MMVLHSSPTSPFSRKVTIAADMLGLTDGIEIVMSDFLDPKDPLRLHNPLGKIPALVLDDGPVLYDSRVIVEYLDHRAGGMRLIPAPCDARFRVKTEEALADGLMDAAILQDYECRFRHAANRDTEWLAYQAGKVRRALDAFERLTPEGPRTVADISLACALGYLDVRFEASWRDHHPRLVEWLANFEAEVPSFEATRLHG